MSRMLALSLLSACLSVFGGCATCCAPFDYDYQAIAGRWSRFNPSQGRVGSAFDEAGAANDVVPVSAETPAAPQATQQLAPQGSLPPGQTMMQPGRTQPGYMQPGMMQPGMMAPGTRSVVPRNMGESYLPRGQ